MDTRGLISLDNTIYKTEPSEQVNTNSIVLTEEEKAFLQGQ
ncbi:hypothetical protein [Aquimarina sp. RZ0]|nr:hypothetical protein [Aquimarina sp. RZ0]